MPGSATSSRPSFPDVKGLKSGAVVRVAGVEVGKVTEVGLVGSEVEVTLEVNEENQQRITTESRASIGSLSLLGEPVIDITPSTQGTPLKDGDFLPAGRAPGQLSDVAEGATQSLEQITGDPARHPRRQGHGREAVHRRRGVSRRSSASWRRQKWSPGT